MITDVPPHLEQPVIYNIPSHMGPSPAPSGYSMSTTYSSIRPYSRASKLQRTASGNKRPLSAFGDQSFEWSKDQQKLFESSLAWLTASAGFSFNWVNNPEFVRFCQQFLPHAELPSRKVLSNRILPTMLRDIRAGIREKVNGQLATVQCGGWTGPNSHHLIAYMVTVGKKVCSIQSFNTCPITKLCIYAGLYSNCKAHHC